MGIKIITTLLSTPLSNYDLTMLEVVKDELDIEDNAKNAILQRYITGASAAASQYCNRKFQIEKMQDAFWPDREPFQYQLPGGAEILQLSRWPVVSPVISVVENGITLVEGTDFTVDYAIGALYRLDLNLYPWRWCAWPIVVQFSAGFSTIPDDVQDAVVRMVTRRYSARGRDPNLKQQNVPGVLEQSWWIATGTESGNMSPDISDILDNYRVPLIA